MDCESPLVAATLARLLAEDGGMERDLDYMRQLMADMEASEGYQFHMLSEPGRPLKSDVRQEYHVKLMLDEGMAVKEGAGIIRMTAKGHDFLDHTRDKDVWERSKAAVEKIKGHSLTMLAEVAEGYVRAKLREITGLDLRP